LRIRFPTENRRGQNAFGSNDWFLRSEIFRIRYPCARGFQPGTTGQIAKSDLGIEFVATLLASIDFVIVLAYLGIVYTMGVLCGVTLGGLGPVGKSKALERIWFTDAALERATLVSTARR